MNRRSFADRERGGPGGEGDQLARGLREREPERLVPLPGPPPREPAVQHVRVAAPGVQVHPGCGARADEVGAEDAAEEEGREVGGGLEGPFDQYWLMARR